LVHISVLFPSSGLILAFKYLFLAHFCSFWILFCLFFICLCVCSILHICAHFCSCLLNLALCSFGSFLRKIVFFVVCMETNVNIRNCMKNVPAQGANCQLHVSGHATEWHCWNLSKWWCDVMWCGGFNLFTSKHDPVRETEVLRAWCSSLSAV
jgi:hypothetical protein